MNLIQRIALLCCILLSISVTAQDTNWITIDCGPFTVQAPPGWKLILKNQLDSYPGYLTNNQDSLSFDYVDGKGGRLIAFLSKMHMKNDGAQIIEKIHQNGYIAHLYSRLHPDGYRPSLFIDYTRLKGKRGSVFIQSENLGEANRDVIIRLYKSLIFNDPPTFFKFEKTR
jgi:hypothetical protein